EVVLLETIWDLHDKVSDAIHALSRAHFLRAVRRRASASASAPGLVHVKGRGLGLGARGGDEVVALAALAEEDRSLHAIRAALEDLEDQFECFLQQGSSPRVMQKRCSQADPHQAAAYGVEDKNSAATV
uniref:Uncharacterized protein n=1 Tax=Zea mays TaxID=4577 RepID=A0A804NX45_MAIZE